jgi:hypothetical protein
MVPDALILDARFIWQGGLAGIVKRCLAILAATGIRTVASQALPVDSPPRAGGLLEALAAEPDASSIDIEFAEDYSALIFRRSDAWYLRVFGRVGDGDGDRAQAVLLALGSLSTALARTGAVLALSVTRQAGGANCLPRVPLADAHRHVVLTTRADIEAAYDRPDVFSNAFDAWEEMGDRILLMRAMDAVDNVSFLDAVQDGQRAMARAAKPGGTSYGHPVVRPEERPIYAAGEPTLLPVGYLSDAHLVEYSCALSPGEHVHGWEVDALHQQIIDHHLPDGRPIDAVRVVFFAAATAEQERRPLLDVGAKVFHAADSGELVAITT